jgi:hypothetical protein
VDRLGFAAFVIAVSRGGIDDLAADVILDDGQPVAVQASQLWVGRLGPFARTMAAAVTARFGPPVLHDHDPQLLTAAQRLLGRLHDELLRRGLATAAHAMQELQDQFDRAVAHMVSAILTARRREHRPVIPEPLTTVASQAAVNALTKLSVVRQFDDLLRGTRILAVMVCPDPEHHRAVVLYCLSPLEKGILSDATRQALTGLAAKRMDDFQAHLDQLTSSFSGKIARF